MRSQAGDDALAGDTVEFVSAEAANLGGSPAQVQLTISYRLPTPCHQTRVIVNPPGFREPHLYQNVFLV